MIRIGNSKPDQGCDHLLFKSECFGHHVFIIGRELFAGAKKVSKMAFQKIRELQEEVDSLRAQAQVG